MTSKIYPRAFTTLARPARQRSSCSRVSICSSALANQRRFSTTPTRKEESQAAEDRPRWKYTPPGMRAPISLRSDPSTRSFKVNSDPQALDEYYIRMLGNGGEKMLSEEIKWQTVTHKSFDQGRRGYNSRLAFLGKWIVQLQASLALVRDTPSAQTIPEKDSYDRTPFQHPALEGLESLTDDARSHVVSKKQLAQLGQKYGLQDVVRWEPKNPNNLAASGLELVLAHTMYSVIGAIAMEQGGLVANQVVKERILNPIGLRPEVS